MPATIPKTLWTVLREIIQSYSFNDMKTITAVSGMDTRQLAHLTQRGNPGASKGNLLDGMDGLVNEMSNADYDQFIIHCVSEMLSRRPTTEDAIRNYLQRVGWGITDGEIYPLELQLDYELGVFDEGSKDLIQRAIQRYRDGDLSGAITHICGILDRKTEEIFSENGIADHNQCSYNQKVIESVKVNETQFKANIRIAIDDTDKINKLWKNHWTSINQASLALASYRRNASDAHGQISSPTPILVQDAINKAIFILRSLS